MKRVILALLVVILMTSSTYGQVEETLETYAKENAKGYLQPFVSGVGTSMNRGWYQTADVPTFGLTVRVGFVSMLAPFTDSDRTFLATTQPPFEPTKTVSAPTVVGSEQAKPVEGQAGTTFYFPGGFDLEQTGFIVPQVTVGSFLGTAATVRFMKFQYNEAYIDELLVTGLGVRHNLDQYIPLLPIDIAAGVFWQSLTINDDLLTFNTLHYGVQASRQVGPLDFYGGVGFDQSTVDIKYTFSSDEEAVDYNLSMDGENGMQVTLGLGFDLFLVHLNAGLSFGNRTVYTAGAFLGL